MTDETRQTPEIDVPTVAVRICQIVVSLMVLDLVLLASMVLWLVLITKSVDDGRSSLLTNLACGLTVGTIAIKPYIQDSISRWLAWAYAPPELRELTRFKRGSHFCFGTLMPTAWYMLLANFCWIVFLHDRQISAAAFGVTLIPVTAIQFPTMARAKAWGERYFRRPDSLEAV